MSSVKVNRPPTALSAEQAVAGLKDYGQLTCDADGVLFWVEYRPEEAGRNCLMRYANGVGQNLTPPEFDVRSRVHEYGGLSWCLIDQQSWVFVNKQDQQLYRQTLAANAPEQLTFRPESRFGEPHYDALHHRIIMIEEIHSDKNVSNRLVFMCLSSGLITVLHEGQDFYSSIALSVDGLQCLFISWDHPNQPWIATQLHHCCFDKPGQVISSKVISSQVLAGSDLKESILQPSFDADGKIWAITDQSGWWNLCCYDTDKQALLPYWSVEADCTTAPWQFGGYHYVFTQDSVTVMRLEQASAALIQLRRGEVIRQLGSDYHQFRAITAWQNKVYAVVNSVSRLPHVVEIDHISGEIRELSGSELNSDNPSANEPSLSTSQLSLPQHVSFSVDSGEAFGFFYPPLITSSDSSPENDASQALPLLPPVVLFFHGGPTACTYPVLNPRIQYWTQRGFAVMDLNYRGSSGYGRAYRLLLHKRWGITDVEDAEAAVRYLSDRGLINARQAFVRGSSAGGFTALAALAFSDCFSGGASLYGVTDPLALATATHKFESHYMDWLIGSPATQQKTYQARSPLHHVKQIQVPVIFFQGELDAVVVPEQTRSMVAALQQQHTSVEAHYYVEEGHGFRSAANLADALEKEYHFYQRVISS
ncbi:alpha/beta hydrolase family protein [Neptunomonas antarctica]|uniref:Prolyl oligopeptidase family protein n=1 Tax=Neptunomonas antarctica TaxID=619304 RepID=A0A1N7IV87_9GAMM|nr:prolyl oligopeptidase family serine peptidase [Neptunomonas antarctica]SIS40998.1 Prolyl oligopeptidase family protein [Neptunomonas antarctica]